MQDKQKTILWDFDGTLAERPGIWSGAMAEVLRGRFPGSRITRDDIRPHLKNVFPWDTPDIPHPELSTPKAWWERLEPVMARAYEAAGIEKEESINLARLAHFRYIEPAGFTLYDDTISTLELLSSNGWRHVILSNHVPELRQIVNGIGLGKYIDICISSANTGYEKPNPQAFMIALEACGSPDAVWMIGDSLSADIEGANSAGIPAVLVHTPNQFRAKYYASTLIDVIPIIDSDIRGEKDDIF